MSLERSAPDDPLLGPDSEADPVVSIVLPTMNEEVGIETCVTRIKSALRDLDITGEIIVSDSSEDHTPQIAADLGAIVVEPDELGYGYAYRYAFERTRGDYIIIGDADTTYDFGELPTLLEPVMADEADIVLGSRLAGEIKPGAMPLLHQFVGNPILTRFLNLVYDTDVSDAHSGFRVLSREAMEQLDSRSDGMEFASEMLIQAAEQGLRIKEVPITYHQREGEATLHTFRDGWRHVKFMLVNAPGYLFYVPGFTFAGFGVVLMLLALLNVQPAGQDIGIHSMVAGSLLTIVGYQVVMFGLLTVLGGDPIREPADPVTTFVFDHVTVERGVALGLMLTALGGSVSGYLILLWIRTGFQVLPSIFVDVAAFTAIVLGIQTVFTVMFASIIADETI